MAIAVCSILLLVLRVALACATLQPFLGHTENILRRIRTAKHWPSLAFVNVTKSVRPERVHATLAGCRKKSRSSSFDSVVVLARFPCAFARVVHNAASGIEELYSECMVKLCFCRPTLALLY